jgi:uncharacterized protein (TIGR02284 family)
MTGWTLASDRRRLGSTLNALVAVCIDSERAYHSATQLLCNRPLLGMLVHHGERRAGFVRELQRIIRSLGERPKNRGTAWAAFRLFATRAAHDLVGPHDGDALRTCERLERTAASAYDHALRTQLSSSLREALTEQRREIVRGEENAHALRLRL